MKPEDSHGHIPTAQLVASGASAFFDRVQHNMRFEVEMSAPVDWKADATALASGVIDSPDMRRVPTPAAVFAEFVLSKEAQEI